MIPVNQTITGFGGNCFPACVASILEKPIEEVPHFFSNATPENQKWTQSQWEAVLQFAKANDCQATWLDPEIAEDRIWIDNLVESGLHYIAFGDSVAGKYGHCVVMQSDKFVHDPAGKSFLASAPWLFVVFESKKVTL